MCEYCRNYFKPPVNWSLHDIIITAAAKYTYVGDGQEYSVPFRYCPSCGAQIVTKKELCEAMNIICPKCGGYEEITMVERPDMEEGITKHSIRCNACGYKTKEYNTLFSAYEEMRKLMGK